MIYFYWFPKMFFAIWNDTMKSQNSKFIKKTKSQTSLSPARPPKITQNMFRYGIVQSIFLRFFVAFVDLPIFGFCRSLPKFLLLGLMQSAVGALAGMSMGLGMDSSSYVPRQIGCGKTGSFGLGSWECPG